MRKFDRNYAKEVIERLRRLQPGVQPKWGVLKSDELVPHLIGTMRYSMGDLEEQHFMGNWITLKVVGPLLMNGILPMPKGVQFKDSKGKPQPALSAPGNLDDLEAEIERYIAGSEAGSLDTARHGVFGDLDADGWAKMHVVHFNHHLKQFGL